MASDLRKTVSIVNSIPNFFIYGEPNRSIDVGFIHAETVMARRTLHQGHVRAHKHDQFGQITFWTKGTGRYFIEDQFFHFKGPALSFVPSRIVHGFDVDSDSDAIVVSIADGALSNISPLGSVIDISPRLITSLDERSCQRIGQLMNLVLEYYEEDGQQASLIVLSLAGAVLSAMSRLTKYQDDSNNLTTLACRLRRLIDLHFKEECCPDRYAEILAVTPYLLGQTCKKSFGLSVKELIVERRLLEAKRLLLFTVRPLEDIAFEIGMNDPAYFSRFFRSHVGEPPSFWRRRLTCRDNFNHHGWSE